MVKLPVEIENMIIPYEDTYRLEYLSQEFKNIYKMKICINVHDGSYN